MPTRRAMLGGLGAAMAGGVAAAGYAFWIEPAWRLSVVEHHVRPQHWPAGRSLTIAALADLHAGEPQMPLERVEVIVHATNALRPDLIVLLGDYMASGRYVTRRGLRTAETAPVLAGLRASLGVFAVLGNHDWWNDGEVQRRRTGMPYALADLSNAGIAVLHNATVRLGAGEDAVALAGLGSTWAFVNRGGGFTGADDLPRTLAAAPEDAPLILLCHEPDIFPRVPADRVALTLCGHTHGGQVRLFGRTPVVPSRFGSRYAHGHVVEDGRHLVVSGGLGTSVLPVRFGVPPEITLIRLG